jgi:hypothetical protein
LFDVFVVMKKGLRLLGSGTRMAAANELASRVCQDQVR